MKGKVRIAQEADNAPRPRVATIGDSLRASVCAPDAAGMRAAWEHIAAPSSPWKVVRMKNKVSRVRVAKWLNAGNAHARFFSARGAQFLAAARDLESDDAQQPPCLHANLLYAGEFGNIVIEVQFHLFSIMEIKKESHKLYEVVRAATMEALRI